MDTLRAAHAAVDGISCMSPRAPTRERARGAKRLSTRITATTKSGSSEYRSASRSMVSR
ncbi:hypothetical protein D3C87_1906620 [compost metagenome]